MYIYISNDIVQIECDTWLQSMYLSEAMNARKSYSGGKRPDSRMWKSDGCGVTTWSRHGGISISWLRRYGYKNQPLAGTDDFNYFIMFCSCPLSCFFPSILPSGNLT